MKFGFVVPGGDIDAQVAMGQSIEAAGWDGVFVAELVYGVDAWVTLGALAATTKRIRLGTLLTPPSRRRPWTLASQLVSVDRLSGGRAVISVGLGALDTGFAAVGEATDRKERAELLDESLDLLNLFQAGGPFQHHGHHHQVEWGGQWALKPIQKPRVPVWSVGLWPNPRSMARPLRFDGILPATRDANGDHAALTADDVKALVEYVADHREATTPFDIVLEGVTPVGNPDAAAEVVRPLADAGATWWIESMWQAPGGPEEVQARIADGPPPLNSRS